jgi:anti-anti-sigma factor
VRLEGATCVIKSPKRVDVSNASILLETIKGQVESGCRQVIIDLNDTEAVDSTALGALVQVYKWLHLADGSLCLARVSEPVRRVLTLTRLDDIFPMYPDVITAMTHE